MSVLDDSGTPASPPLAPLVRYEVQIAGLSQFAGFVDREVGRNIDPNLKVIDADHVDGLGWGRYLGSGLGQCSSDVVGAARTGHNDARYRSTRNMQRYIDTAAAMVETIHRLMATYQSSEQLARLDPATVSAVIATVNREQRSTPPPGHQPAV